MAEPGKYGFRIDRLCHRDATQNILREIEIKKKAGKPKFSSKFNREASRLGDVGSEDPSF